MTRQSGVPVTYAIGQLPTAFQLYTSSRDKAWLLARRFAQRHGVDVWCAEGDAIRLVDTYRSRSAVAADVF